MNYLHDRHKRNTHNLKVQHSVPKNGNPLEQKNSRKYCKNKTYPFEESKDTRHSSKSSRQPKGGKRTSFGFHNTNFTGLENRG